MAVTYNIHGGFLLKKAVVSLVAALMLAGCAQPPKRPDLPADQVAPTPVCQGEEQCSRMWGRAIEGIQMVTRMKVMNVTDSFIQTFPASKVGHLNGQVFKQSLGDGKYAIKASIGCSGHSWCSNMLNSGLSLFNSHTQGFEKRIQ